MEFSGKLLPFVSGGVTMCYALAGVFFLRFWVRTRDSLFVAFACAFWLMALNQALTTFTDNAREEYVWAYGLRLLAFVLIIAAIVGKNLRFGRR